MHLKLNLDSNRMTRRGTEENGLHLNEDMILWSLCGRNPVKAVLANPKSSGGANRNSDQQINQSPEINSLQERGISGTRDNPTTKDRLVMVDSLAYKTFPSEVQLCWSSIPGYKLGVMATCLIPQGVWIGPYQGKLIKPEKLENQVDGLNGNNLWEIFHENQLYCYVDGSDVNTSSWMRFIQCARSHIEQNLNGFQYQGNIYYRAMRDIHVGEELLVWYDDSYPQYMGIPLMTQPRPSIDMKTYLRTKIRTKRKRIDTLETCPSNKRNKGLVNEAVMSVDSVLNMRIKSNSPISEDKTSKSVSEDSTQESEEVLKRTQKHEENMSSTTSEPRSPDRCSSGDTQGALKCGQCSANFLQRNTLQIHICPKQTNSPYQCGYCNLSFTNPSDLRGHVLKHASEKPFKCGFCARSFVGSTTLNNHIRMHTGDKPFNCQMCGMMFSQGAQFARHLRFECNGNVLTNRCES